MSRVALVYPYFRTHSATELLFPPLGAANLASQLGRLGIESRVFDCTFSTFDQLMADLTAYQPDLVGISSMITMSRNSFRVAEAVRAQMPESTLVAGGPLPTLYPERYSAAFDAVFRGEADLSFPRFCRDLFDGKTTLRGPDPQGLAGYDGLFVRRDGLQVDNPTVHFPEKDLDSFPLPYRGDFDHLAYQQAWRTLDGTQTTSIITTLGCSFNCDFCSRPIFGNLFRRRSLGAVFAEIAQLRGLGYDGLWIADDNFTLDVRYLRGFCERIAGSGMSWSCLSRVTGITAGLVRQMKAAGCRRVYLGLETGDPETLKLMNKRASLEQGRRAVRLFHDGGIEVAAFFIVGYPGETTESIERTFSLALELPLDYISFNVPYPLPGSPLFERVHSVDADKDWTTENEITFVYESEFDAAWLQRRIGETTQEFARRKGAG
jgi:anaerobic magnesium-protoporphyrin IX monomethyl ester cyclase